MKEKDENRSILLGAIAVLAILFVVVSSYSGNDANASVLRFRNYGTSNQHYNSTNSANKSTSSTATTQKKNNTSGSSMNSYDDGYDAVYEDDDYDTDRYNTDSDYANGVDDALEDMEDGDWD